MSLRAFHLFFIVVSSALCALLIIWGLYDFRLSGGALGPCLAVIGVAGLFLLTRYFRWFRDKNFKALILVLPCLSVCWASAKTVQACAVCFKDPDSLMTKGAMTGVGVLFAVIVIVLALIVVVARSWIRRARSLAQDF